mmetsp:Transcript_274/g.672  ORF Transcript_274/g.672 Transcript_274/m.672 type:complete len:288 (-) Transcript_274:56-919(-)
MLLWTRQVGRIIVQNFWSLFLHFPWIFVWFRRKRTGIGTQVTGCSNSTTITILSPLSNLPGRYKVISTDTIIFRNGTVDTLSIGLVTIAETHLYQMTWTGDRLGYPFFRLTDAVMWKQGTCDFSRLDMSTTTKIRGCRRDGLLPECACRKRWFLIRRCILTMPISKRTISTLLTFSNGHGLGCTQGLCRCGRGGCLRILGPIMIARNGMFVSMQMFVISLSGPKLFRLFIAIHGTECTMFDFTRILIVRTDTQKHDGRCPPCFGPYRCHAKQSKQEEEEPSTIMVVE